ncbi:hypothetical protein LZG72_11265 [Dyadobacter sp. CY323]|nr:hypothetical protein [Dyadobacter sp. CY323]
MEDKDGNIWLGTMNSGIYRFDGKNLTNFLNHADHPFNLGTYHQSILDIFQDRNGNLWFSSWNGGGVWRYNGRSFTNFVPSADYYQTKNGVSEDGRSFPVDNKRSPSYLPKSLPSSELKNHISDDMIFSISEDNAGNIWFATRRHGACRYDGKTFTTFSE